MQSQGIDKEPNGQFESRKGDHIRLSLSENNQAQGKSGLELIDLVHEALPDLDFSEVSVAFKSLKAKQNTPFLISGIL